MKLIVYFLTVYVESKILQIVTSEYDEEYYEYYGQAPDNYEGNQIINKDDGVTQSIFYCWACNSTNLESCNQNGHLEKVIIMI